MNAVLIPKRQSETEFELVRKAKAGNLKAYEELVKRYEGKLYALIYKIVGDKEEAKDILQDTFISAFKGLNEFKEKSTFSTWIYRVATNNALMKLRKNKKEIIKIDDALMDEKVDWSSNINTSVYKEELKRIMDSAIGSLPVMYRAVFVLRDVDGVSTEETAEILNISTGAVKSRLHRARLYLREELSKYFSTRGKQIVLRQPTSITPYKNEM